MTHFVIFGAAGLMMEIVWTGIGSLAKGDLRLVSTTSIWMFFIYGLVAFFEPLCDTISVLPFYARGGLYVVSIFLIEYFTGGFLRKLALCPWDYSGSRFSYKGLVRFDYAPVWFAAGLVFERIHYMLK